ncbi:MAG: TonB-dependent receptor [Litorilituus sp.]|jgi:iron complex outermembrane receptor protein|nr:TonB-dependent receptor [Litorilituus sp.]
MKINIKYSCLLLAFTSTFGYAQDNKDELSIEVIEVTSRKKVESLQTVPDAITAFNDDEIESARIKNVNDFATLTPNLIIREGFRAGASYITMRGITTPQQGLPPVTFVVDDVQAGALDFVNQDLDNIERIEVLRGPQGALYGAGAMAGAINIITKHPADEWEGALKLDVAQGNDRTFNASVSGGVTDEIFARVNGKIRKADGLIDSAQGEDLDFNDTQSFNTRWQYLGEQFSADLRYAYSDYEQGAIMQDLVALSSDLDDFSGPGPERSFIGREHRTFHQGSVKLIYEFTGADVMWISSDQKVDQHLLGDVDWSAAPLFIQDLTDDFAVKSHEFRVSSNSSDSYDWLFGAYYQERKGLNDLTLRLEPELRVVGPSIFTQIHQKKDEINAVFAQVTADLTDNLELTIAARYDSVEYKTTQYTDKTLTQIVQVTDSNGDYIDTQTKKDTSFQPKLSLSYIVNEDIMVYGTYAKGFRPGFYNSGNLTKSEETKNYEIGMKSAFMAGRGQLNAALFYIDYSDQQFSTIITEAPFRVTSNIPETKIKGFELESIYLINEEVRFTLGYGHTTAEVQELNQQAPSTPKNTLNLGLLYDTELSQNWQWQSRVDYRFQDSMTLGDLITPLEVDSQSYINVNTSISNDEWKLTLYVDNLTDELTTTEANYVEGLLGVVTGVIRAYTPGRQIGASISYKF